MILSNIKHGFYHSMTQLKVFKTVVLILLSSVSFAQFSLSGKIVQRNAAIPIEHCKVILNASSVVLSDKNGIYK